MAQDPDDVGALVLLHGREVLLAINVLLDMMLAARAVSYVPMSVHDAYANQELELAGGLSTVALHFIAHPLEPGQDAVAALAQMAASLDAQLAMESEVHRATGQLARDIAQVQAEAERQAYLAGLSPEELAVHVQFIDPEPSPGQPNVEDGPACR